MTTANPGKNKKEKKPRKLEFSEEDLEFIALQQDLFNSFQAHNQTLQVEAKKYPLDVGLPLDTVNPYLKRNLDKFSLKDLCKSLVAQTGKLEALLYRKMLIESNNEQSAARILSKEFQSNYLVGICEQDCLKRRVEQKRLFVDVENNLEEAPKKREPKVEFKSVFDEEIMKIPHFKSTLEH